MSKFASLMVWQTPAMADNEWGALRERLRRADVAGVEDLGRFVSNTEFFEPSRFDEKAALEVLLSELPTLTDAKLVGAGGTDMRLGFRGVEDERPRPDVVICFTDGDTPWPSGPPPGSAVIAAILGRRGFDLPPTPKWATRVECLVDDRWAKP